MENITEVNGHHHPSAIASDTLVDVTQMELEMLRSFYLAWVKLHSLPRTPENRQKQEDAAIEMTESAHAVAQFRRGKYQ